MNANPSPSQVIDRRLLSATSTSTSENPSHTNATPSFPTMRAYEPSGDQLARLKLLAVFESNFRALPTLSIRMIVPLFPTARIAESSGLYEAQRRCSLVWDIRSLN